MYAPCPGDDGHFLIDEEEFFGSVREPLLGRCLGGRFIVASVLGQGSMGYVYKAYQQQVDRMVAMKVFQADKVIRSDEGDRAIRERFVQEARVLAKLSHPNCVTLYDFGYESEDDVLYIAMEYVGGISLRRAVRRGIKFEAITEVVRQILMALREAHALGIVHRDLKPENIILSYRQTSDEQLVKVLDFGIAKLLGKGPGMRTEAGLLFGTPAYMSPEQCRGETDVKPSSDVYSLGCMTFEMITGHLPFDSDIPQEMVRQHQFEPVPELVPRRAMTIPEGVEHFVHTCMAKEPEERYVNAAAALRAFEEVVGGDADARSLAQGVARLRDDSLSKRVAVPGNRLTGADLDPTGDRERPPEAEARSQVAPQNAPDITVDGGPASVVETMGGEKRGKSRRVSRPASSSGLTARPVLVVSAVVAVTLFLGLLVSVLYILLAS